MADKTMALTAENLSKSFGSRGLWEGFSHRFDAGSLTILSGPSDAARPPC